LIGGLLQSARLHQSSAAAAVSDDEDEDEDTFIPGEDGSDSGDDFTVRICSDEEIFEIPIWSFDTVLHLKKQIHQQKNIAVADQRLIFRGKLMQDSRTLSFHNVKSGDVLKLLPVWAPTPGDPQPSASSATSSAPPLTSLEERLQKLSDEVFDCLAALQRRIQRIEENFQS
jgi:hypothetical protein